MMPVVGLEQLFAVCFVALGVTYVITGSKIGYPLRVIWWLLTRKIHLDTLAFCPACNAWWTGGVLALVFGLGWCEALQAAFASCGLAAVAQGMAGIAANDREVMEKILTEVSHGVDEERKE